MYVWRESSTRRILGSRLINGPVAKLANALDLKSNILNEFVGSNPTGATINKGNIMKDEYDHVTRRRVWRISGGSGYGLVGMGRSVFPTHKEAVRQVEKKTKQLEDFYWNDDKTIGAGLSRNVSGSMWLRYWITECFEEVSNQLPH